jgi:surface antigen
MPALRFLAAITAVLWLAACSSDPGRKEARGTSMSAAAGAIDNRGAGASIGSSGLLGDRAGAALDDEDRKRAVVAELQALETGPSGAPVAWRNPESGRYGNVVPGPVYQENGVACREYTHTVYVDGNPQTEHGTACRRSDGTWASAS